MLAVSLLRLAAQAANPPQGRGQVQLAGSPALQATYFRSSAASAQYKSPSCKRPSNDLLYKSHFNVGNTPFNMRNMFNVRNMRASQPSSARPRAVGHEAVLGRCAPNPPATPAAPAAPLASSCKPHSVLSRPAQRPERGCSPAATGLVQGQHPMER